MVVSLRRAMPGRSSSAQWRGRSGAYYTLTVDAVESFALNTADLTVIARGPSIIWAGSSLDIVNDQFSRAKFRLAIGRADRVFHCDAPPDDVARMTMIWDLEGAEPVGSLSVA